MLDVRRMRVLREVAVHGTIAGAATALDFTPSAVSQHVAALERETGVALVDRGPSSVVLTDAGRALVQHAETVLAQLADAEAELRAIEGLSSGRLRVGSFASVTDLTVRALGRFRSRHPQIDLTLNECEAHESVARLRGGQLDVAVVYSYDHAPLDAGQAIELHALLRDPLLVAVPRAHPLAGRDRVPLQRLAGEDWISEGSGTSCHRVIDGACHAAGFEPRLTFAGSSDYRIIQGLVAAGMGVAFIPELARQPRTGVALARLREPPGRTIATACRAGGRRSPAVAAMLDTLADTAAAA
jgi:DNA-binding transcriptional LysR family regulator